MNLRRMLLTGAGVLGLGAAIRFRLPQVASYLLAAGIRRSFAPEGPPNWTDLNDRWKGPKVAHNPETPSTPLVVGGITLHPWYRGFDPGLVEMALDAIRATGATVVRTDVRWSDIIPDGARVDAAALEWHVEYIRTATECHGLDPFLVLSNPPAAVLSMSQTDRLAAWDAYVAVVTEALAPYCRMYQVFNEPNNPVFRFFDATTEMVALRHAAARVRQQRPEARICMNFLLGPPPWRAHLERVLSLDGGAIDLVGLDYYPGTWALSPGIQWEPIRQLLDRIQTAPTNSPWRGRRLGIVETGYATNLRFLRTELDQAQFIISLGDWLKGLPSRALDLVAIYEIWDEDSEVPLDPEAHFGLLKSDGARKASYEEVKRLFTAVA